MTLKELKEIINKLPNEFDDMDVFIEKTNNEYRYSLVEVAKVEEIKLVDEDGYLGSFEECILISDDDSLLDE